MGCLLIIDDELDILESLRDMFLYEVLSDIDVYAANSARKAIQLLETMKFDVVLTDIRMPGMNGLELFKIIKENWPQCRVIFLTGYKEFDYLYEIHDYKEVRYLLKSEDNAVIIRTVMDAFDDINKMVELEYVSQSLTLEADKAQMWLRKEFINQLIYTKRKQEIKQNQLDNLKIPIQANFPVLAYLFRLDNVGVDDFNVEEFYLYQNVVQIVPHFMPELLQVYVHLVTNGYGLLLMQPKQVGVESFNERQWERLFNLSYGSLEYIQENFHKTINRSLSFVTSSKACSIQELYSHYNRLKRLAISRIGFSEQMILKEDNHEEITVEASFSPVNIRSHIHQLEINLETRKPTLYYESLNTLLKTPEQIHNQYYDPLMATYHNVAIILLNFIVENNLTAAMSEKIHLSQLCTAGSQTSIEELFTYLYEISNHIFEALGGETKNRTNEALKKVQSYIENNLHDDLTLNRLAEVGCFNASYLSRIFKQTYGCNISEYIGKERVELAKLLLRSANERIHEISRKVGYTSAHSFTRVFKQLTGITPQEYREKYGAQG